MCFSKIRYLLPALFVCFCSTGYSQPKHIVKNNFNSWLSWSGDHKVSAKWGFHFDAQWRRNQFVELPQQNLLRPGIIYYATPQITLSVGYAIAQTFPYGKLPVTASFTENRLWQQIQLKSQVVKLDWVGRFRLEQRFSHLPIATINGYSAGPAVYTNRIRLLNRFSLPIGGKNNGQQRFYVTTFDELMINFGKNVGYNVFDQNRFFGGLGYKLSGTEKIELGYMNQLIMKSDGVKMESNHTLSVAFISYFNFYKR